MKIIRNRRKDGNARNVHEVINEVILGLCSESMSEDAEHDEESIEDIFEACDSSAEELADELISAIAEKAAEAFDVMVHGMRMDIIFDMISLIEDARPMVAVSVLQGMFYAYGMEHAAKDLGNIAICRRYCEDAYDNFIDQFMQTDEIDWFIMERTLGEVS